MLPCILAAPTLIRLAGRPYLARPLTLGGFALLLRNGADALGLDGDGGHLPEFADAAFQAWLASGDGATLLLWCCLKPDQPWLTMARCASLAKAVGDVTPALDAALRRARMALPQKGRGKDISRLDWAATVYLRYAEAGILPAAFADLSLDQAWLLASGGAGLTPPDDSADLDELQRRWEATHQPGVAPEPVQTVEEDLAAMGLVVVKESPDVG